MAQMKAKHIKPGDVISFGASYWYVVSVDHDRDGRVKLQVTHTDYAYYDVIHGHAEAGATAFLGKDEWVNVMGEMPEKP